MNGSDEGLAVDGGAAQSSEDRPSAKKAAAKKTTAKKATTKKATAKKAATKKATADGGPAEDTAAPAPATETEPFVEPVVDPAPELGAPEIDLDAVLERFESARSPGAAAPELWPDINVRTPWVPDGSEREDGGRTGVAVGDRLRRLGDVLRQLVAAVGPRRLAVGGAVLVALVVLVALGTRLSTSDGGAAGDGATSGTTSGEEPASSTLRIAFPEPEAGARGPEERLRPVGVRSRDVGFEVAVVSSTDLPTCAADDEPSERAVWFDASGSDLHAVAPGEHGVALLLAAAGSGPEPVPFLGIEDVLVGASVEVARSNGTVLAWRVIDVVRVGTGSDFPVELLSPVAEQRLVLVGCGADVDGASADVYVLALRAS